METYFLDYDTGITKPEMLKAWQDITSELRGVKGYGVTSKPEHTIRVATWNIHGFRDAFGQGMRQEQFAIIRDLDADVLCLQECLYLRTIPQDYRELGQLYPHFYFIEANQGVGNIIFSKFQILDGGCQKLPGFNEGRGVCWIVIQPNIQKPPIQIWNCHLDVYDETGRTRVAEIHQTLDYIKQESLFLENFQGSWWARKGHHPVQIWCGDFNALDPAAYNKEEWEWLQSNMRARSYPELNGQEIYTIQKAGFRSSFELAKLNDPKMTCWTGRAVDFIWGRNLHPKQILDTRVVVTGESDHYPVICDLAW